jgi:hypothetical protein
MSESDEMKALCEWLNYKGLIWKHCRDEIRMKAMASSTGFPDLLIVSPAKYAPHGAALELKDIDGKKPTKDQMAWITAFQKIGVMATWRKGFIESVKWLTQLGY